MNYQINKREREREELAEELLNTLIDLKMPDEDTIKKLYQQHELETIQRTLQRYLDEAPKLFLNPQPKIIQTIDIQTTELAQKKQEISTKKEIANLKTKMMNWEIPNPKELEFLFKQYSPYAHQHLSLFNTLKKERSCELPYSLHLMRSAIMSEALNYDERSNKPPKFFNLLWAMHDSREDLFRLLKTQRGKNYKLQDMNKFMNKYFPEEHHEYIRIISNDSDAILKYLKLDKQINITDTKTLKQHLQRLRTRIREETIKKTIEQMLHTMPKEEPDTKDFYETIKKQFYQTVFLEHLAQTTIETQELVTYEGKGTIDLLDNFIARHSRDLRDRRVSIKKMLSWHQKVPEILQNFNKDEYSHTLENRAEQILKFANHGTKELAIFYLTRPLEQQDHLNSTITTLLDLASAIYYNADPKKLIL